MVEYNLPSTWKEAKLTGSVFYFTGIPCQFGHIDKRYTCNSRCKTCNNLAARKSERKDPQKSSARSLAQYYKNREHRIEMHKAWYAKNKQHLSEYESRRHQLRKASGQQARATLWAKANPELASAHTRKRRAQLRGADGTHDADDVKRIRRWQNDKCACCSVRLKGRGHVDHIVALANGGSNWPNNLQMLCQPCNNSKYSKDPIDFMRLRGKLL